MEAEIYEILMQVQANTLHIDEAILLIMNFKKQKITCLQRCEHGYTDCLGNDLFCSIKK